MTATTIVTTAGSVDIHTGFPVDRMNDLVFGLDTADPAYQPIFTRKQSLEQLADGGGIMSLALFREKTIIGYAVIAPPSLNSRWAKAEPLSILELKAVEVARPFRNQGIAGHLLTSVFSGCAFDDDIVILSAYAWLWDMAHTSLSCSAYREMLISLYTRFGFESCRTNEPNVCLKAENIFMVRIGQHVSSLDRERFKWLRFGIFPPPGGWFHGKTVEYSGKNGYVSE